MNRPTVGMVLAAGRGERLRPITDELPKPLVHVLGRPLIDHAIDRLAASGVERVVVNTHHLGQLIAAHLAVRKAPAITISAERLPLETGGGILQALPLLGTDPFYAVNADSLWLDGRVAALDRLARAFDPVAADAILLLQPTVRAIGYEGNRCDFFLDHDGRPRRVGAHEVAPYLFAGIQILSPALFEGAPAGAFSLNRLYDRALAAGRLQAIVHDGEWYTVTDVAGLDLVRAALDRRQGRG